MNILFLSIIIIAQIVEFFNHFFIFRPTKVNKNHFLICDIMNKYFCKKLLYGQNLSYSAKIAAQLRIRETAPYFLFLLARMTVTTNSEMMTTALIDTIQTAGNQAQTTDLEDAKQVAWAAIKEYAAKRNVDAKQTWDGISQHPDYAGHEDDPAWYIKLADEFRANAQ